MRYPNLFLVGAAKAGTTTLHRCLGRLDQVFAPTETKEPAFFHFHGAATAQHNEKPMPLRPYQREEHAYLGLYDGWGDESYGIDASTYYLTNPATAEAIKAASPDAKIVAILREPVSRAYSHYLMEVRDGWVDADFATALKIEIEEMSRPGRIDAGHYSFIRQSRYLNGLQAYHRAFGSQAFRVYRFEDLASHEADVLADMGLFLGLPLGDAAPTMEVQNAYAKDRFPALTRAINRYRYSVLRDVVNQVTPRVMRDRLREALRSVRLKQAAKPPLPEAARALLQDHLKDDYDQSLTFARNRGILHES